jgi:MAGUK p55 subfamily protein 5
MVQSFEYQTQIMSENPNVRNLGFWDSLIPKVPLLIFNILQMPFVVFVAPPSLDKLKRWKMDHSEPINDDELRDIIERAREMEDTYGHYFDMIIVYSDPERAYQQLVTAINSLEREPQWVPAAWLANNNL